MCEWTNECNMTNWKHFRNFRKRSWQSKNHVFVSSLSLKHHMSLIWRVLNSPGLVHYFSNSHHGQKIFRPIWKGKHASKMRKFKNFEMVRSAWKFKNCHVLPVFDSSLRLKIFCMNLIQRALDNSSGIVNLFSYPYQSHTMI